jgi:MFS family permease
VLGFGPSQTSLLYAAFAVIGVGVQLFLIGRLNDRFGPRNVLLTGLSLGVIAMAYVGFVHDLRTFFVTLVLWALANSFVRPTLGALVSDYAPVDRRGTIMGVNDSLNSFAFIVGPLVSTSILSVNVHYVGILPVVCGLVAIAIGALGRHEPVPA